MFAALAIDHDRETDFLVRSFLALVTPGEEKTLRAAYGLPSMACLEDVMQTSDPETIIVKIRKLVSNARLTTV